MTWYVRNKTNGYIVAVESNRKEAYKTKWEIQRFSLDKFIVEKAN